MGQIYTFIKTKMTQTTRTITLKFLVRGQNLDKTVDKSLRIPADATPSVLAIIVKTARETIEADYRLNKNVIVSVYPVSKLLEQ